MLRCWVRRVGRKDEGNMEVIRTLQRGKGGRADDKQSKQESDQKFLHCSNALLFPTIGPDVKSHIEQRVGLRGIIRHTVPVALTRVSWGYVRIRKYSCLTIVAALGRFANITTQSWRCPPLVIKASHATRGLLACHSAATSPLLNTQMSSWHEHFGRISLFRLQARVVKLF
jgi:hypothetical protein